MRTWNDYKEHVKSVDPEIGKDMDEVENISLLSLVQWLNSALLSVLVRENLPLCVVLHNHL